MGIERSWRTQDLGGAWEMSFSLQPDIPQISSASDIANLGLREYRATVPGNFELDLLENKVIAGDPFYGNNIVALRTYESAQIWYYRRFQASAETGVDVDLVFEGLDCLADIYLNGALIGSTDNMLIEHRLPVTGLLKAENELLIHIRPAALEAKRFDYSPGLFALPSNYDSLFIRKAPHMYGWDIMPRALSAGLWRPVRLEYKPLERLEDIYLCTPSIADDASSTEVAVWYQAKTSPVAGDRYELVIEGNCGSSCFNRTFPLLFDSGWNKFVLENPSLWWPKGYGKPNLYQTTARLMKNGACVDSASFHFGVRAVELVRTGTTDESGSGQFLFKINGKDIFVHGSNWVPLDAYHSRDHGRIRQALEMADDLNCNMLRCWGGNVYEDNLFYDLCDQKGILVWQDFAMACAIYPQDQGFPERMADEARSVVRRLRQHPCLVIWSGDNECDAAYGWIPGGADPNNNRITRVSIPEVLREQDPYRPYLPSSPYIDPEAFQKGDRYLPEAHLWGPRNYYKSEFYIKTLCHFVSEIGYHGCPAPGSLAKFLSPDKLWPYQNNDEWLLHCTSPIPGGGHYDYRIELMATQVRELFGDVPDNLADFAMASQACQAEALKFFIEQFRSQRPRKTGILWWNLIDGWPQFSDAVVDYFFERKLAYEFIKRAQQPVYLMVTEPQGGLHYLVADNTTSCEIPLEYVVRDVQTGEALIRGKQTINADGNTKLGSFAYLPSRQAFLIIEWRADGQRGISHYLCGKPPFRLSDYKKWLCPLQEAVPDREFSVLRSSGPPASRT